MNDIGAEGAKHIGNALKVSTALTNLKCAPHIRTIPSQMRLLCCQQGSKNSLWLLLV
jgi:hypothetical protein